ncbi:MAG TPA: SpoIIE family protein phosphatase [Polyangiaceae bacterium]|nr:SpoIIE family protein phosphatase [Polyangiaceae bacterium]
MKRYPIALKLLLLAGFPVLGVLVLASLVVGSAREQLQRGDALGSVESLAELSEDVSTLVYRLQSERARLALELASKSEEAQKLGEAKPAAQLAPLSSNFEATDAALSRLGRFVSSRDLSRLPTRLSDGLTQTLKHLDRLGEVRTEAQSGGTTLSALTDFYAQPSRRLIRSSAALSELTDDGEVLRSIAALVAVLELEERASAEHALLSYVYATGDFPPGSFRDMMTLITEEQTFVEVLKTNASTTQFSEYQQRMQHPRCKAADDLRRAAIESIDGDLEHQADAWFSAQGAKVDSLRTLEERLNRDMRRRAESKLQDTHRAVITSSALVGAALLGSVVLALLIGRGVTRSVHVLRDAANRVAQGSTDVRVELQTKDELAALGHAFNEMTSEIARAREGLREQTRMSRDLEIAAGIQSALLPPSLAHPELEFAGRMQPAEEVGGDFYDVLCDDRSRSLWVTIGDVSGHGVPAGLVMLMTQSAFAAYFRANPLARPDEVIRGVNDLLNEQIGVRLRDDKYVTGLLLQHTGAGRFVYAGAHEWPLVWRTATGKSEMLEAPGPWLGIKRDLDDIPVSSLALARGDLLCLYSDGLIEARDAKGELFDMERLSEALERAARDHDSLQDIADDVLHAVAQHAHEREDDWTLLLIRRAA